MTLRKITIDNSVRYIPKKEKTKEIKQHPTKHKIQPVSGGKLNQNISQNSKKFLKSIAGSGFGVLTK